MIHRVQQNQRTGDKNFAIRLNSDRSDASNSTRRKTAIQRAIRFQTSDSRGKFAPIRKGEISANEHLAVVLDRQRLNPKSGFG